MKIITLHHSRNFAAFRKVFPTAKFLGFECGYWGPAFQVTDKEWSAKKLLLPQSCTIDKIELVKSRGAK